MPPLLHLTLPVLLAWACWARDVPDNVRDFYNAVVTLGSCDQPLVSGFYDMKDSDDNSESSDGFGRVCISFLNLYI